MQIRGQARSRFRSKTPWGPNQATAGALYCYVNLVIIACGVYHIRVSIGRPCPTYPLRPVLKVTTVLGRSIDRRSVLVVPTSSRAKSNNIFAGNKLNSDYFSFYSLA